MHRNLEFHLPDFVETPNQEAEEIKKRWRIPETLMWEPELAAEAMAALREQEKKLTKEQLRTLLAQRWEDAFFPPAGLGTRSVLADKFVIEPVSVYSYIRQLLEDQNRIDKTSEAGEKGRRLSGMPNSDHVDVRLYGTDLFAHVVTAGTWIRVPSSEIRAVGSSLFSCCTALVGKSDRGDFCFAHVPGPGSAEVERVGRAILEEKFGSGTYVMISPERKFIPEADPRKHQLAIRANTHFANVASSLGIEHRTYTEMYPDEESVLHDTRVSHSIVLTDSGIQALQVRSKTYETSYRTSWRSQAVALEQTLLHDAPELDYTFVK